MMGKYLEKVVTYSVSLLFQIHHIMRVETLGIQVDASHLRRSGFLPITGYRQPVTDILLFMSEKPETIKHEGGCLCGRTRFTIFSNPTFASFCHCDDCRQSTGAPVSAFVGFRTADMVWQGEKLAGYKSSSKITRSFCPECGTSVSYEDERLLSDIYIYVGVMDDPDSFPMGSHSYISEKLTWLHISDDLPQIDGTAAPRDE